MYHWKFYNKEEISFFTRSKCKFVFAVGSSIYTWQNKKHKFYGIFTWICSIPPRIPQNSSVPNEAEICSPPHLGDLPNHSENEVSPPSPLQEGKKRRRVHQSWIKQQRISSSNFTSKRAAREEFSGSINPPMAAWIVSRIAHVCSKPWNNKKRIPKKGEKKNITPSARRDETKSKTYEEGHGGGIHAHTRSPATAYDEWTEEGGARQGSRRSKATNLQRRKPKRKKKRKNQSETRDWTHERSELLGCGWSTIRGPGRSCRRGGRAATGEPWRLHCCSVLAVATGNGIFCGCGYLPFGLFFFFCWSICIF